MMVLMTHNTDISDAWEREGEDPRYFYQFSPKGYAVGINAMVRDDPLSEGHVKVGWRGQVASRTVRESPCDRSRRVAASRVGGRAARVVVVPPGGAITTATCLHASHLRVGLRGFGGFGGSAWSHDYPAADKNLSSILDYITHSASGSTARTCSTWTTRRSS